MPLSDLALRYINEWKQQAGVTEPNKLVSSTRTGRSISPNNVLRRAIYARLRRVKTTACDVANVPASSSSWSHDKGGPVRWSRS